MAAAKKVADDVSVEIENEIVNAEVAEVVEAKDETSTKSTAKAGERSAKAVAEAEAKEFQQDVIGRILRAALPRADAAGVLALAGDSEKPGHEHIAGRVERNGVCGIHPVSAEIGRLDARSR